MRQLSFGCFTDHRAFNKAKAKQTCIFGYLIESLHTAVTVNQLIYILIFNCDKSNKEAAIITCSSRLIFLIFLFFEIIYMQLNLNLVILKLTNF